MTLPTIVSELKVENLRTTHFARDYDILDLGLGLAIGVMVLLTGVQAHRRPIIPQFCRAVGVAHLQSVARFNYMRSGGEIRPQRVTRR